MSKPSTTALIIMAKAPDPGLAKTRLIPALGAQGAARLAQRLLEHTIQTAAQTSCFGHRELCVTPNASHQVFERANNTATTAGQPQAFAVTNQGEGDLGARMQRAFERALARFDSAILIGTDAPGMTAQHLDQAARDLARHDVVLVPALDGGYTLIGLKQSIPSLFADMVWSRADVMAVTRARLSACQTTWHEYPPMADIDEPQDLIHLPAALAI
jgi:rSAM/selenodomain-associated transferase 1